MTRESILWRVSSGAATGFVLTGLLALTIWTGVSAVSRVGSELALALRGAAPWF